MSAFRREKRRFTGVAVAAASLAIVGPFLVAPAASAEIVGEDVYISHSAADAALSLSPLGSYETGIFDESGAEIVAYHAATERLFVVNAQAGEVDVLDISEPATPSKLFAIKSTGVANSVAIRDDGLGVIAFEAPEKTDKGSLVFFDAAAADGAILGSVTVGALPDMVTLSEDGSVAVVANEGEPSDDFTVDPEGSVGIVDLPDTVAAPSQSAVRIADFHDFEAGGSKTLPADARIFGPTPESDLPISRNLEPEYIAIDGDTAYAALQEANAVAVVDLAAAEVTEIWPLGFKDLGAVGNGIDPSDRDPEDAPNIGIRTFDGLKGIYMPDGINAYTAGGQTYLVTANEGDAREWGEYVEPARVKDLEICADSPFAALTGDEDLGRLNVTTANGFNEAENCYDDLYAYGGRSFSIWTTDGEQVFDSGDDFEQITADAIPDYFNSNHTESGLEGRSDDKGPEPENLTIGEIDGRTYAFIGFERVGGIIVYDITDPEHSAFVTYVNNRDFSISVEDADDPEAVLADAGDLGPEGLTFISGEDSPTGEPMLAVANEVSGTTTLFSVDSLANDDTTSIQVLGINDFHGRIEANGAEAGAAVLAGAVNTLRTENPNTLFVSAGDNIGASTFTSFSQDDNPTIDALAAAGLDASAVGNHEFDQGFVDLRDRVVPRFGGGEFALGANVYLEGTKTPALQEYSISEVDGVRVGFVGVVTEQTASMVSPAGIADIEFGDQTEAANRVAAQLTDGDEANGEADVIVLLVHDGSASTDCAAIATEETTFGEVVRDASPQIDAILSAHTHQKYACSYPVDGWEDGLERPVLQAQQYGMNLDQLQIEFDKASGEVVSMSGGVLPLTGADYPADADVAAIVAEAKAEADEVGTKKIGEITADISRGKTASGTEDRGIESSLGNLVADMQLWATSNDSFGGEHAQIALMNPGGLRADLLYGDDGVVTYEDVASVQPFGNTLWTMDLTGAQLKDVLEEQWQPDGSSRPKLHLGVSEGFSYVYEPDAARGEHIVSMSLDGVPVADGQVFRVATNSFLATGGDNFSTFALGANPADSGQIDLIASVDYFEAHPVVHPAPLGRAVLAGPDAGTGAGGSGTTPGDLASTGVNVGLIAVLGVLLALAGGMLLRRRRLLAATEGIVTRS